MSEASASGVRTRAAYKNDMEEESSAESEEPEVPEAPEAPLSVSTEQEAAGGAARSAMEAGPGLLLAEPRVLSADVLEKEFAKQREQQEKQFAQQQAQHEAMMRAMGQQTERLLNQQKEFSAVLAAALRRLETWAPAGPAPTRAELVSEGVEPSSELPKGSLFIATEQKAAGRGARRSAMEGGPGLETSAAVPDAAGDAGDNIVQAKDVEFEEAEPDSTLPTDLPNRPPKNI
jgi:hypothetical protein